MKAGRSSSSTMHLVDQGLLAWGAVAACLVIAGVVILNSLQQAGYSKEVAMMSGAPVFVVGWVLVAVALSMAKPGRIGVQAGIWVASAVILVAAMVMSKLYVSEERTPPVVLPVVFALAWLALGWLAGNGLAGSAVGVLGAIFVVVGMFMRRSELPWRTRKLHLRAVRELPTSRRPTPQKRKTGEGEDRPGQEGRRQGDRRAQERDRARVRSSVRGGAGH